MVCSDASLLVGGACQRDQAIFACNAMLDDDSITDGIDIGNAGLHIFIDDDTAADTQLEAGILGQCAVGSNTDGHDDHIAGDGIVILDRNGDLLAVFKGGDTRGEQQLHALAAQISMDLLGHIKVDRRHDLIQLLDQSDLEAKLHQVFSHLQADKAAADNNSRLGLVGNGVFLDLEGILNGAEREDIAFLDAGDGRHDGLGTGRENQLIVAFGIGLAGFQVSDRYGLGSGIDGGDFTLDADIDVEAVLEAHGGLQSQLLFFGDGAADIVGQTTVGIGYITAAFKHDDFSLFIQSTQTGCSCSAAGNAADNEDFHGNFLLSVDKIA